MTKAVGAPAVSANPKAQRSPPSLGDLIRGHPLVAFFAGTFMVSWSYWVPDALAGGHWSHFSGLVGPAVAALAVNAVCGSPDLHVLRDRTTRWRVAPRWYAAALAPLLLGAAVIAGAAFVGDAPSVAELSRMKGVPELGWVAVAVIVLVIDGFGEEIGWRGFAWPRLRETRSMVRAAALLTIPWALWHVPLVWIDSGLHNFAPVAFPGFVLSLFAGCVVLGWLFDKTGSVAVVALWHTMLNMATAPEGATTAAAVVSMIVIVFAVVIVQHDRHRGSQTRPVSAR
jgi:membrane protease YdiL (CAAX protease family)